MAQARRMTSTDMQRINTPPEELLAVCPPEIDQEVVRIPVLGRLFPSTLIKEMDKARTVGELIASLNPLNQSIFLHFYMQAYTAKYGEGQN